MRDPFLKDIAWGPKRTVKTWPIYFINGYKFHTQSWNRHKSTYNCGVCIKGQDYGTSESDFYGILQEIVQLEYTGLPLKNIVLFKCEWYDPKVKRGVRIHKDYGIVEINTTRRFDKYDPFIFAQQAVQVYYAHFPANPDKADWAAVIKTKARSTIEDHSIEVNEDAYQEDEIAEITPVNTNNDELPSLRDNQGVNEEIDGLLINQDLNDNELEEEDASDEDDSLGDEHESSYDFNA